MKKLSRIEIKKIIGGLAAPPPPPGDKNCTSDCDCGTGEVQCDGTTYTVMGHCHNSTCSWNKVC